MISPRIYEEITVIDEDGNELAWFRQEVDPRFYFFLSPLPEIEDQIDEVNICA